MKNNTLTIEQAYRAMFYFLEQQYKLTNSDDIGGLLGSMDWTIWDDMKPADPAVWEDWIEAVKKSTTIK